jgi:D-serine deaminase-like pyridoxal phosphate-dependent protein
MMPPEKNEWYLFDEMSSIDSPALIIYIDRVKENIRTAKSMIDDVNRLRPHVKTNKSKEAVQLLIDSGIQKFKCATIAEAEMLALCNANDVLLAYQPVGPKLGRFIQLIKKYGDTKFSCLADNIVAARQMAESFLSNGITVPVYIDLNTGMNRTGIVPGIGAIELYISCSQMKGIEPTGLHVYDGHIRDADFNIRKQHCDESFAAVEKMKIELLGNGVPELVIIAGGSPTFSIHCKRKKIECSPGTFIYWDKTYLDLCPEQKFLPAALVMTRVISLPDETKLCLDLGHKSVAAENELTRRIYFPGAPQLKATSQSEEHLVVDAGRNHSYKVGDLLFGIPFHICPTVALYEKAYTIENRKLTGKWKAIARDRKITC